jgi:hypothetical protein
MHLVGGLILGPLQIKQKQKLEQIAFVLSDKDLQILVLWQNRVIKEIKLPHFEKEWICKTCSSVRWIVKYRTRIGSLTVDRVAHYCHDSLRELRVHAPTELTSIQSNVAALNIHHLVMSVDISIKGSSPGSQMLP